MCQLPYRHIVLSQDSESLYTRHMNNQDLQAFIQAFDDFMKHFETEELYYEGRKVYENHRAEARRIQEQEIEAKAAELEVTCDYYMMEFM